jgi:hypothetical protein
MRLVYRSQHPLDPPHPTGVGLWTSGVRPIPATPRPPIPRRAYDPHPHPRGAAAPPRAPAYCACRRL